MIRYYFDIRDGDTLYADEEGLELDDQTAAEVEAANVGEGSLSAGRAESHGYRSSHQRRNNFPGSIHLRERSA